MAVEAPTETPESSTATVEAPQTGETIEQGATKGIAVGQPQTAPETKPADEKLSIMGVEIEKSKVPPELLDKVEGWNKAYTEKSQRSSEFEKKAKALDMLSNNAEFQKWYWDQMRGPKPQEQKEDPYNLTPERQAELLSEPQKMREYIEGLAQSVVNKYALPAAQRAQQEAQLLRQEQNVAQLEKQYPDFSDLNNQGKIEEVVEKYARKFGVDIDLEDAYWLAKRPYMESEATLKAHQRVQEKVSGSTLPPSGSPQPGIKVIPGKGLNFEDKMRIAAEHAFRGEKIKFDS